MGFLLYNYIRLGIFKVMSFELQPSGISCAKKCMRQALTLAIRSNMIRMKAKGD